MIFQIGGGFSNNMEANMETKLTLFIEKYKHIPALLEELHNEQYDMLHQAVEYAEEFLGTLSLSWGFDISSNSEPFEYPEDVELPDHAYHILTGYCITIKVYRYSSNIVGRYRTGLLDLEDTLKRIKKDTTY